MDTGFLEQQNDLPIEPDEKLRRYDEFLGFEVDILTAGEKGHFPLIMEKRLQESGIRLNRSHKQQLIRSLNRVVSFAIRNMRYELVDSGLLDDVSYRPSMDAILDHGARYTYSHERGITLASPTQLIDQLVGRLV